VKNSILTYLKNFLTGRKQRVKLGGECSSFMQVISGVPQGSVLGPLLFLIYVNDLPECMSFCQVKLYADDSKLFVDLDRATNYSTELQSDLNNLAAWCKTWQLKINPTKCVVLPIGFRRKVSQIKYSVEGQDIEFVDSQRDLGVIFSATLSSSFHVRHVVKSAVKISGLLLKTFACREKKFMVKMFCTRIRPILEYCCESWSPYTLNDIDDVEQVQRAFTRRIWGLKQFDYSNRLLLCNLEPLELRRLKRDLILVYKILNRLIDLDFNNFFEYAHSTVTRGHSKKLYPRSSKTNRGLGFFALRIVNVWNILPEEVVSASSLNVFKQRLNQLNDLEKCLVGRAIRNN